MISRTMLLLSVLGLILYPFPSSSNEITGAQIMNGCRDEVRHMDGDQILGDRFDIGYCSGMINGVRTAIDYHRQFIEIDVMNVCIPIEIKSGQLVRVFLKYLDDHPEEQHENAAGLMIVSWRFAFLCDD
jgi:hypothetical protein